MTRLALLVLSLFTIIPSTASSYWQQRVKYNIDVTLIDSIHSLDGELSVQYFNNSPDTLREVYFHLYYLAFQPGSMMQVRSSELSNASWSVGARILALKPEEQGKYRIDQIIVDGAQATHEITGTVMRVTLPKPLLPNTSTTIGFTYFEQIPKQTRRGGWMSSEGVEYSMAQWYPKIAEYDEHGWHANEYIAREFYGVWGDFDVSITLPSSFTVAASGQVMNPQEVGHGYDKIAAGEKSGQAMPEEKSGMTTWKWRAENVHDFAWVADKTYIHDWATIRDSITIHSIHKTSVASMWKNTLKYTEFMINTMSDLYYPYPYRNFYNTHAGDGGMEYPQLVQNSGYRSEMSMAGITAHEGAHQWFYGILGNNESREAYLDEGFTSYATTQIMVKQFGNEQQYPGAKRTWLDWFIPMPNNKGDNYRSYLNLAKAGYEEPLAIPHDWAREDVNAGQAYGKMQAIVSMLEYTLGESTFDRAMKEYFNRWKFKHPSLDDLQRVMEDVAKTDLDWFFDQWFRTDRTVDYSLGAVKSVQEGDKYRTTLRLRNREQAVMPIDVKLQYADGTSEVATIPLAVHQNTGYRKRETRLFFEPWDWVARTYEGSILTPHKVVSAEIDPSWRLQDLNRLNNGADWFSALPRGYWEVWKQLNINPPLDGYYAILRPIIGPTYLANAPLSRFEISNRSPSEFERSGSMGTAIGIGIKYGAYLNWQGDLKAYMNMGDHLSGTQKYEGRITGTVPLEWIGRLTNVNYFAGKYNDLFSSRFGIEKTVRPEYLYVGDNHKLRGWVETHDALIAPEIVDLESPFSRENVQLPWESHYTRLAGVGYNYSSRSGSTTADIFGEASLWSSSHSYVRARFTGAYASDLFWGIKSVLRLNGGVAEGELPIERAFNLQAADPTAHHFSDTYNAYRWLAVTKFETGLRGGAGLLGFPIKKPSRHQFDWGKNMIGVNWDMSLFKIPYVPQLSVEASIGAGWVGETFRGLEELWKFTTVAGGLTLNVDIKSFLPWQLQGVMDQYAFTPVIKLDPAGKIFLGASF